MTVTLCDIVIPIAKYHNDILHPCIRYSPNGVLGHHWWLIVSPWYNRDDKIENPILFYGIEDNDNEPPTKWEFFQVVQDSHESGYNSDPSIGIYKNEMFALWREVMTPVLQCSNLYSGVFIKKISKDPIIKGFPTLILSEKRCDHLSDLSPEIILNDDFCDIYTIYHKRSRSLFKRIYSKLLRAIGIRHYASRTLGIYHRRILADLSVVEVGCYPIRMSACHLPWHFDILDWKQRKIILLYCEFEPNLYIGEIIDGKVVVESKPLSRNLDINNTYKPTGVIINNILWLYYTDKRCVTDPYLNQLYRTSFNLNQIFVSNQ